MPEPLGALVVFLFWLGYATACILAVSKSSASSGRRGDEPRQ